MSNDNNKPDLVSSVKDDKDNKTVVLDRPIHYNTLPIGTRFGEFEIIGLVGEGGFGIVYLVQDHSLERKVAIKEYMPSLIASRMTNATVSVRSEQHRETFETGRRSFVNEARLLAQFDHPALVKVYRFWEANGTAYMVMPYYEGHTLREALKARVRPVDENWIRKVLMPVTDALGLIHRDNCLHRDIAPDNIMLLDRNDRPVLLDFGAARRVIGDMTQALTVILKPGFAPVEQYSDLSGMQQGPWTDIYALAAVIHFMILGKTPPSAIDRLLKDTYQPLASVVAGRFSDTFLRGVDHCLAVKVEDRPQSMAQMREVLGWSLSSAAQSIQPVEVDVASPGSVAKTGPGGAEKLLQAAGAALVSAKEWLTRGLTFGVTLVKANRLLTAGAALTLVLGGYLLLRATAPAPAPKPPVAVETTPRKAAPSRKLASPTPAPTPAAKPTPANEPAALPNVPALLDAPVLLSEPALLDESVPPDASALLNAPEVPGAAVLPAETPPPVKPAATPSRETATATKPAATPPRETTTATKPAATPPRETTAAVKPATKSTATLPPPRETTAATKPAKTPSTAGKQEATSAEQSKIRNYYDVIAAEELAKPKPIPKPKPAPPPPPKPEPKPKPPQKDIIRSLRDSI